MITRPNLKPGKVSPDVLSRTVYPFLGRRTKALVVGPGVGRDSAIVRHGKSVLVFSVDPITGASKHVGRHVVEVNANDIATTGARPVWFLCTILMPPRGTEQRLALVMKEIDDACRSLGVSVIGGHTEATPGLVRPVVSGFMVGEALDGRYFTTENARKGDRIIMTKSAGIEGTAILASDYAQVLTRREISGSLIRKALRFYDQISIVREASAVAAVQGVDAMHDPTEGGVLNGLWEMAEASGLGIDAWADKIPVNETTREICLALGLDPLKLMGSGSLLIAVRPSRAQTVIRRLEKIGVLVTEIGRLTRNRRNRVCFIGGQRQVLEPVPRDELYKLKI